MVAIFFCDHKYCFNGYFVYKYFSQKISLKQNQTCTYREKTDGCQRGGSWGMGKICEAEWEIQVSSYGISNRDKRHRSIVNVLWQHCMVRWQLHWWATYRAVESLCCTPEINITPCVNHTKKKKKKPWLASYSQPEQLWVMVFKLFSTPQNFSQTPANCC